MNLFLERLLLVIAVLILIFPLIGIPRDVKDVLLIIFGAAILVISFITRQRDKVKIPRVTKK